MHQYNGAAAVEINLPKELSARVPIIISGPSFASKDPIEADQEQSQKVNIPIGNHRLAMTVGLVQAFPSRASPSGLFSLPSSSYL